MKCISRPDTICVLFSLRLFSQTPRSVTLPQKDKDFSKNSRSLEMDCAARSNNAAWGNNKLSPNVQTRGTKPTQYPGCRSSVLVGVFLCKKKKKTTEARKAGR